MAYPSHLTTAIELTNLQVLFVDNATHSKKLKLLSFKGTLLTFVFTQNVRPNYSSRNIGLRLKFSYYISHSTSIPFICLYVSVLRYYHPDILCMKTNDSGIEADNSLLPYLVFLKKFSLFSN